MSCTTLDNTKLTQKEIKLWFKTARTTDFPEDGGAAVLYKDKQIAVFHFADKGEWYATQNQCPHKQEMALARGLTGDTAGEPKVACPFHKKTFSLNSGKCMNDDHYEIETYPVKIENGFVYIGIPENF